MTNEVVLNRLNELRSTIALSDPDSASAIDSLLAKGVDAPRGSGIFAVEFVSFMREVCEDIRKAQAKANGKGDQRRALVRILKLARDKSSERPVLHNPFMNGGKQWFVSGYHGVGLNTPMPEFKEYVKEYFNADFICGRDGGIQEELEFLIKWAREQKYK